MTPMCYFDVRCAIQLCQNPSVSLDLSLRKDILERRGVPTIPSRISILHFNTNAILVWISY